MAAAHHRVAILGAGFSGICVGARLKQQGRNDFVIFEKANEVGGTWRENTYPGVACDVPSHLYSLSFDLNPEWTREYAAGAEIQRCVQAAADKFGLRSHLQLDTKVESLRWEGQRWRITLASGGQATADVVVSGLGGLHVPKHPDTPGLDAFPGKVMHTAEWDAEHVFEGERTAVIGTGSSGVQVVPELRKQAEQLLLFQRTPAWVLPRFDHAISSGAKSRYRNVPGYMRLARWARFALHELGGMLYIRRGRVHDWFEARVRGEMARRIHDPVLREKLLPQYPLGCKRPCISDNYLEALQEPNVDVITESIERIEGREIVTSDGQRHEVDTIVEATGFLPFDITSYLDVTGRGGARLTDAWSERVEAHRTMMVPSFPNFFLMLGPNSGLGYNSVLYMIEAQTRYILAALQHLEKTGTRMLDPRPEASRRWNDKLQAAMQNVVFGGGCNAWYTDEHDRNFTLWPWSIWRYAFGLSRLEPDEFEPDPRSAA